MDVSDYMFGSILAVSESDVVLSAVLGLAVILMYGLFFNRLFAISYDEVNCPGHGHQRFVYSS